jgi:hypothetical protein
VGDNPGTTGQALEMTDHRINLFYDFTTPADDTAERIAALRLAQVNSIDWIHPDRLVLDAERPIGEAGLWDWAAWSVSPDFHTYVRDLLNSSTTPQPIVQPLRLVRSDVVKALLEGRYRSPPGTGPATTGLVLRLGNSPRLRELAAASSVLIDGGTAGYAIQVEIESVALHLFRTRVGVVVPRLRLVSREHGADIPPEMLVEIVPRLGDERHHPPFAWKSDWTSETSSRFAMGPLLWRLIEPAGCAISERQRVYSYATVVVDAPGDPTYVQELAFRLSRHYSAVYHPTESFLGTVFTRPFETVLHAASREGGCTLVMPTAAATPVEYLNTWIDQAYAHVYLPLQVAAFHEYIALLGMAQGAGVHIDPNAHDDDTIKALKDLSHRFLLFRLRYRLLQVSAITVHELAYAGTAQALGIEALSTKISRDLVEVERRLVEISSEHLAALRAARAARERAREKRVAWITAIGTAALAYITMASFADHLVEFMKNWSNRTGPYLFGVELVLQLLGFGLCGWSVYRVVWWTGGSAHDIEHLVEHEMTELKLAHRSAPETVSAAPDLARH